MKGILLAGGSGTRLYPLSQCVSKQLLPVYNKPAIYYPLSTLMLSGIREILIISTPRDTPIIENLLGDGSRLGLNLQYKVQDNPNGIAQAFIIGEKFIGSSNVCLILGDNLFFAQDIQKRFSSVGQMKDGACVFACHVNNPSQYGIVEFDKNMVVKSIEEKPKNPKTSWAVPGLYFYDNKVVDIAKSIQPSHRNELEITDVNKVYLQNKELKVEVLSRGTAWFDLGTFDNLLCASTFIQTLEQRQNLRIGCIEEIAYRMEFINKNQLESLINSAKNIPYMEYLSTVYNEL